jgi:hypothetical protein
MNETVEALSAEEQHVGDLARQLEPPLGAEQQVFERLQASIAGAVAAPFTPQGGSKVSLRTAAAVAATTLIVGAGLGLWLGRTAFAPRPPPPQVIERVVRVEVPVTIPPAAPPAPDERSQPPRPPTPLEAKERRVAHDDLLAQERELIDTARSALLHSDPTGAITALTTHADRFKVGRLAEERESLWVQALVMAGALPEARAKAARFHEKFPKSLLGPTIDAALGEH